MSAPRCLGSAVSVSADMGIAALRGFACPICRSRLVLGNHDARCPPCDRTYVFSEGTWRFLPAERHAQYQDFLQEYQIVRDSQGWGRRDAGYFLALPEVAPDDPQRDIWRRRGESCHTLLAKFIEPMAARRGRPLRIVDLGAGNCWLTYRLTKMGHQVAAVDLSVDATDGLGAHRWYRVEFERANRNPFTLIQAEFDHLPLIDAAVDVTLFNASLHYSIDFSVTLREALRVLTPGGTLIIMDSPIYRNRSSGEQMVHERETEFQRTHGFHSDSLASENFLTWVRLEELAHDLALRWEVGALPDRLGWMKRRWRKLCGLRELAEMPVIAGYRV